MDIFTREYNRLNEKQREAVDTIDGPVMVVAGPGTGKTQILTLRIANILKKTDTPPDGILALTFTDAAARGMKKRLFSIIGAPAYRVHISTFHSFCNDIITQYPESFPHIIGSQPATEIDQIRIISRIITGEQLELLRPFGDPLFYVRPALSAIQSLKREGISPEQYADLVVRTREEYLSRDDLYHEKGAHKGKMKSIHADELKRIDKNEELSRVYRAYQQALFDDKLYDYADMIMETALALGNNEELLQSLQERFLYVLVDEHQDTNNSQNKVIELLCGYDASPNIFIVGDEKQAIFRFQGASLQNFLYFKELYPTARVVVLEENYRSTQHVLDASHGIGELISRNPVRLASKGIFSQQGALRVQEYETPYEECVGVARSICARIQEGIDPHEIAVLYRDNRDAEGIARALEEEGVRFVIESDQNVFADPDIQKFVSLVRMVHAYGEPEHFIAALHIDFLKVPQLDLYKIVRGAHERKMHVQDLIMGEGANELGLSALDALRTQVGLFEKWARDAHNLPCGEVLQDIALGSGFLDHILSHPQSAQKLEKFRALFSQVQVASQQHPGYRIADFVAFLDTVDEHKVLVKTEAVGNHTHVRLMTAHRSKGLEFEEVYIVQAYDGHWGNKRMRESLRLVPGVYALMSGQQLREGDALDDERRLFYVALTRAKRSITISYAKTGIDGRDQLPCQFIQELGISPEAETIPRQTAGVSLARVQPASASLHDKAYVTQLFEEQKFTVTALNNFLTCPWRYFYVNLIRVPTVQNKFQIYGTVLHGTLNDFFRGTDRSKEHLLELFDFYLERAVLSLAERGELQKKGRASLGGYFDRYHASFSSPLETEFSVHGVAHDGIELMGVIDRIEKTEGGVEVIDYKTGKPKSRNELEGKTKSADGNYFRQLVFYKLLLDGYKKGIYRVQEGTIDFLEPDSKGSFHRETFAVTQEDVAELTELLSEVFSQIRSCSFWETHCDDPTCPYCALRARMQ